MTRKMKPGSTYRDLPKAAQKSLRPGRSYNDLKKGAMQRLHPFDPDTVHDTQLEATSFWQGESTRHDEETQHDVRDDIAPATGAERARVLHKLSGATKVRRAADGKREFLLHRGMSHHEHTGTVKDGHVHAAEMRSSWTPKRSVADNFAGNYRSADYDHESKEVTRRPGKRVSAWIHEDSIVSAPKQYGKLGTPNAVDFTTDAKPKGENMFSAEHEIIVKPHRSKLAEPHEVHEEPQSIHQRLTQRRIKAHNDRARALAADRLKKAREIVSRRTK